MTAHLYFRPEGYNSEQLHSWNTYCSFKISKGHEKGRFGELTLKKSSWCTTQQLGNVFRSLFVKVVFPPLVTLGKKKKELLGQKRQNYENKDNFVEVTYPPMPMINFILLLCVGHLWNSVNKSREPRQRKPSAEGLLWKNLPFSSTTDVPSFYNFIDRQSRPGI